MTKVLIWDLSFELKPQGGPSGYLYNIKQVLADSNENQTIFFAKDLLKKNILEVKSAVIKSRGIKMFLIRQKWILMLHALYQVFKIYNKPFKNVDINLNNFDIIHFHKVDDLINSKDCLNGYMGKILLTTHSPESFASEYLYYLFGSNSFIFRSQLKKYLLKKECLAYKMAHNILFPTKYSVEPYEKEEKIKALFQSISSKFLYCPTCITKYSYPPLDTMYWSEKLQIPSNSFVIVYVGRHNEIKGYDYLKRIASETLSTFDDVYFVIAGREDGIERLVHPRWIELGWVNYSTELIYQADTFILPNKETYFDIVALEVLRAGTPFILTRTGGNKYLEDISNAHNGRIELVDYGDVPHTLAIIKEMRDIKANGTLNDVRNRNQLMFENNFKMEHFLLNYNNLLNDISKKQ